MLKVSKEVLYEAVLGCKGIISTVAKRLNCSWSSARELIRKDKDAAKLFIDELQGTLDKAEETIQSAIEDGDLNTSKWYLQVKGKYRGYGDSGTYQTALTEHLNIDCYDMD